MRVVINRYLQKKSNYCVNTLKVIYTSTKREQKANFPHRHTVIAWIKMTQRSL